MISSSSGDSCGKPVSAVLRSRVEPAQQLDDLIDDLGAGRITQARDYITIIMHAGHFEKPLDITWLTNWRIHSSVYQQGDFMYR